MTQTAHSAPIQAHVAALEVWQKAREAAHAQFREKRRIAPLWKSLSAAMDRYILALMEGESSGIAVMAVGGYGRAQLFPYSDIDIVVVAIDEVAKVRAESVLYGLWNLPLTVGHAVRTLDEVVAVATSDHTVMTSLLDIRFVAGDEALAEHCMQCVDEELIGQTPLIFVEAKLAERDSRHARALDSRLVLEPNVKEGKGALRDLHTIWWLARYCYDVAHIHDLTRSAIFTAQDARYYTQALEFMAAVRASLHLMSGRADERLTFDAQLALAQTYHYRNRGEESAKRFMKHYFHHAVRVGELTRSFCTLLEEENKRAPTTRLRRWLERPVRMGAFIRVGERISIASARQFMSDPLLMPELFAHAQDMEMDVHPTALHAMREALPLFTRACRNHPRTSELFLQMVLSKNAPHITLRRMSEAGLMERIIPEFRGIKGQMQYDRYHTYTVDEHTLKAIETLWRIEQGDLKETLPVATTIAAQIHSRRALYLAMFTHDIGKGFGAQAERGEVLSAQIVSRLGCSEEECDTVSWLVRNHLVMSDTAFRRDLDDPKTIEDFVALVQSPERLRLLLLITVADIHAVGPAVWNGWKGALLRDLYHRALNRMGSGTSQASEPLYAREHLAQQLRLHHSGWSADAIATFMDHVAPPLLFSRPAKEQELLASLHLRLQLTREPALAITQDTFRAISECTLCSESDPQLLSYVAGVAALMGASIVSAKLMAAHDGTSWVALGLQDVKGAAFDPEKVMRDFARLYHKVTSGALILGSELVRVRPRRRARTQQELDAARVILDNSISAAHTVIEVNAADRLGLLHDIAAALVAEKLVISTAHIATYGQRAVDVFYVKDAYGHQILHPAKRYAVHQAVLVAVA
jgi:[protein-PII] uridylyltransferase